MFHACVTLLLILLSTLVSHAACVPEALTLNNPTTGVNTLTVSSTSADGEQLRFAIENNPVAPPDVSFRRVNIVYGLSTQPGVPTVYMGNAFYLPITVNQTGSATNRAFEVNSNGTISSYTTGISSIAYYVGAYGAANGVYQIGADAGKVSWGPGGATALDTELERSATGTLRLNGSGVTGGGTLALKNHLLTATLFANLGTPSNGTIAYCSDCQRVATCTSGGTGALAVRLNGAWSCS